jgi:hypothetical protein
LLKFHCFGHWNISVLVIVSDFEIRISNFLPKNRGFRSATIWGFAKGGDIRGFLWPIGKSPRPPLQKKGGGEIFWPLQKGERYSGLCKRGRDIPAFAKGRDIPAFAKGGDIPAFAKGGDILRLFSDRMPASFRKQQNIPPL